MQTLGADKANVLGGGGARSSHTHPPTHLDFAAEGVVEVQRLHHLQAGQGGEGRKEAGSLIW